MRLELVHVIERAFTPLILFDMPFLFSCNGDFAGLGRLGSSDPCLVVSEGFLAHPLVDATPLVITKRRRLSSKILRLGPRDRCKSPVDDYLATGFHLFKLIRTWMKLPSIYLFTPQRQVASCARHNRGQTRSQWFAPPAH